MLVFPAEDVGRVAREAEADRLTDVEVLLQILSGNDNDDVLALGVHVQMDGGAHHLGDLDLAGDPVRRNVRMIRADTQGNFLRVHVLLCQSGAFILGKLDLVSRKS